MRKYLLCFLLMAALSACGDHSVYTEYVSVKDTWKKGEQIQFTFNAPDTIHHHNVFINLRNDENYKFSNLFLIVNMDFPNNETVTDTLEYEMAAPSGEWLGKGFSNVKENKLWYKENVLFPVNGSYTISIEQAMRKNGEVNGIENLEGVLDVGVSIERSNN